MIFRGSGVAIITPFNADGSINYIKLNELIEYQITNETDAIIICGTTGEASTLSEEEKKEVIKYTVDSVNKRIPVIAGTGCNSTAKSIEMSKYAESVNADAILVVTPYYNKCNQEGIFEHYKEIANSVNIPLIVYNVPSRTSVNVEPSTLLRLSSIPNIVAVKEASSNISQITQIASMLPKDFTIYSGNDDQTLSILALGASGVISVAANIIPKQMHDLCFDFFNNNFEKAKNIQLEYLELMNNLFIDVNPIPVKEAMNMLNLDVGHCRLPLTNLNTMKKELLKNTLDKYITK